MPLRTILVGLGLVVALGAAPWSLAQTAPTISGALTQVRVDGTTAFADVVRTIVAARPGRRPSASTSRPSATASTRWAPSRR
jgi:hypothetical protein